MQYRVQIISWFKCAQPASCGIPFRLRASCRGRTFHSLSHVGMMRRKWSPPMVSLTILALMAGGPCVLVSAPGWTGVCRLPPVPDHPRHDQFLPLLQDAGAGHAPLQEQPEVQVTLGDDGRCDNGDRGDDLTWCSSPSTSCRCHVLELDSGTLRQGR